VVQVLLTSFANAEKPHQTSNANNLLLDYSADGGLMVVITEVAVYSARLIVIRSRSLKPLNNTGVPAQPHGGVN
jgi:hypothetical protein